MKTLTAAEIRWRRGLHAGLWGERLDRPEQVVGRIGCLQAQDLRMAKMATLMRLKKPDYQAFVQAFDTGRIVRMHLLRCTWQLVRAEHAGWMHTLCAERNRKAIKGYLAQNGGQLTERFYDQSNKIIADFIGRRRSVRQDEIYAELRNHYPGMAREWLSILLRRAECDEVVCSGNWDDRQNTYTRFSRRIKRTAPLDNEEKLARLAHIYFTGHGPATERDFGWWSGLSMRECRTGMRLLGEHLTAYAHEGEIHYDLCREDEPPLGEMGVRFLPSYDEYLIGYKTRSIALDPRHTHKAHSKNGVFYPVIVREGNIIGNWNADGIRRAEYAPYREIDLFEDEPPLSPEVQASLWAEAEQTYGASVR